MCAVRRAAGRAGRPCLHACLRCLSPQMLMLSPWLLPPPRAHCAPSPPPAPKPGAPPPPPPPP
eukprot:SAG25_NODE_8447_length_422_cov_0.619195_1_plen_62_part_01